jgi:hypothetical protein
MLMRWNCKRTRLSTRPRMKGMARPMLANRPPTLKVRLTRRRQRRLSRSDLDGQ